MFPNDGVIKSGAKQLSMSPEGEDIKSENEPSGLPQNWIYISKYLIQYVAAKTCVWSPEY